MILVITWAPTVEVFRACSYGQESRDHEHTDPVFRPKCLVKGVSRKPWFSIPTPKGSPKWSLRSILHNTTHFVLPYSTLEPAPGINAPFPVLHSTYHIPVSPKKSLLEVKASMRAILIGFVQPGIGFSVKIFLRTPTRVLLQDLCPSGIPEVLTQLRGGGQAIASSTPVLQSRPKSSRKCCWEATLRKVSHELLSIFWTVGPYYGWT